MYLYYDRYGTLKEQITFNPARVGNSNVNKIFVYWEGVEEFADWAQELALQVRYLLQDNTQYPSATTFQFSAIPVTAELPFDNKQDLKYFSYGKEYKFLTIDIPDNILSFSGAVKSYIWVLNADKKRILGLGVFAFMVDGDINEVVPDENISLAQWNMISAQLGLLSGSVIDVTCDIATNTLKVYYANGTYAVRNLPPNNVQTTLSTDFVKEFVFVSNSWEQDGEQGYYLALSSSQVGFTDNKFFIQLEEKGEYNSKQGGFVLSDNIFKGNDGSVLLYSSKPFDGRLLLVGGGDILSGKTLVSGLSYTSYNSVLSCHLANGDTQYIDLYIDEKLDKSAVKNYGGTSATDVMSQKVVTSMLNSKLSRPNAPPDNESFVAIKQSPDGVNTTVRYIPVSATVLGKPNVVQTTGNSETDVMSQKAVTDNFARLVDGKVPESQLPSYVDDVVEYDSKDDFPATGETGKIYVDKSTNLTYRWSGTTYIQVGGGDLNVVQTTGNSETDVMSQKAVTDNFLRRPNSLPTETSLVTVSSTGTHAYKKVSDFVDTTSEQTISGKKTWENTNATAKVEIDATGVIVDAFVSGPDEERITYAKSHHTGYGVNIDFKNYQRPEGRTMLQYPMYETDLPVTDINYVNPTYYFATAPFNAPTEPSFIVNAADRTPTWQSAAPILQDYVDDALLGG